MTALTFARLRACFRDLGLHGQPIIAHTSLTAFGPIHGGASTLLGALLANASALLVPTFTYKTMVTPGVGPPHNGLTYGGDLSHNLMAEFFHADMPADRMMGWFPEVVRRHPAARRSLHPILSFAGIHADEALDAQTLFNPLAPIGVLAEQGGWVVLLGVDQTVNTSIHFAEKLAGRRQFTRWALTRKRIVECSGFPGDSSGFDSLAADLEANSRSAVIGPAVVRAIPLQRLFETVQKRLQHNPLDLLCERDDCERCNAVRDSV